MLESHFGRRRADRIFFNDLPSYAAVYDYLQDDLGIKC